MTSPPEPCHVLVADDEPHIGRIIKMKLEQGPFRVTLAYDGREALEALEREPDICLVLLDLKLPKVDGLEVLRRIREDQRTALLPVVILTSSKEQQDIINGYRLGCNSYVRKPVDFDKFTEAAKQLGLYWLLLNEPLPS